MITAERRHAVTCIHGRPGHCARCVSRRRRVARLLDAAINDLDPAQATVPPSTFSLTDEQRCRHARDLRALGWSRAEINRVLVVDPACLEAS